MFAYFPSLIASKVVTVTNSDKGSDENAIDMTCFGNILMLLEQNCIVVYCQVSNIRRTKSQHLKDSRTVLRLSLPNPLKPDVKSRMKM